MYPGVEKTVKFSGHQGAGEDAARQYMQATVNFQRLRGELEVIEDIYQCA